MKKLVAFVIVAALVVVWIFYGRFAVEGGKGPWSMINNRPDVLRDALASGMSAKEKDDAFSRAMGRKNLEGVKLLLAAGVKPKCHFTKTAGFGGVELEELLLASGDDVSLCPNGGNDELARMLQWGAPISEDEFIAIMQVAVKHGVPITNETIKQAAGRPKLMAYLKDPNAAIDLKVQKLALRGDKPGLDADALKTVCTTGDGVAEAPPYRLEPGFVSPVYVFQTMFEEPRAAGPILPKWWTTWGELGHTQVVVCARVTSKQLVKECRFEKGSVINYYDATFELSVREAHTGKQIATKAVALEVERPSSCPIVKFGNNNEGVFPKYERELEPMLRPLLGVE